MENQECMINKRKKSVMVSYILKKDDILKSGTKLHFVVLVNVKKKKN